MDLVSESEDENELVLKFSSSSKHSFSKKAKAQLQSFKDLEQESSKDEDDKKEYIDLDPIIEVLLGENKQSTSSKAKIKVSFLHYTASSLFFV